MAVNAEIEFDNNDKISKLVINNVDLTDSITEKEVVIQEGSKRFLKLELSCDSLKITKKGDASNAGGNTTTTP